MPFVFNDVDQLQDQPKAGDGGCVALIKKYIPALAEVHTSRWRAGELVVDVKHLPRGTAIATFVNGRYPGLKTGNHATLYIATAGAGFYAMEQFLAKRLIGRRRIEPGRTTRAGVLFTSPSDSAQAFYVIEL
jgi:hypothetical protein